MEQRRELKGAGVQVSKKMSDAMGVRAQFDLECNVP